MNVQFGFRKGKSTELAMYSAVSFELYLLAEKVHDFGIRYLPMDLIRLYLIIYKYQMICIVVIGLRLFQIKHLLNKEYHKVLY